MTGETKLVRDDATAEKIVDGRTEYFARRVFGDEVSHEREAKNEVALPHSLEKTETVADVQCVMWTEAMRGYGDLSEKAKSESRVNNELQTS